MAAFVFFPLYRVQLMMLPREFDFLNEKTRAAPFGDVSVVTLIWTDATLDHSQKAEKVCWLAGYTTLHAIPCAQSVSMCHVNAKKGKS